MSMGYLMTWLMVFFRGVGIVMLLPQMAGHTAPIMMRLGLAMCVATILSGILPPAALPADYWGLIFSSVGEVVLGLAMGFVGQMAFSAVELAGRVISSEIGLSAAPGFSPTDLASAPLASFLSAFAVVLFFLFDGHLAVLGAFARSFALAPPGRPLLNGGAAEVVLGETCHVIELGLRISAPFLALNFLITLAFSVLGRAVPRMNVFIMSATVRSVAGMTLLGGAGALIARYLYIEFDQIPLKVLQLLPSH
jgi:flagellar biosynthetic protein FliR